jgi:hypothetical protein
MGSFAVGNYDGPTASGQPLGPAKDYIYNLKTSTFVTRNNPHPATALTTIAPN